MLLNMRRICVLPLVMLLLAVFPGAKTPGGDKQAVIPDAVRWKISWPEGEHAAHRSTYPAASWLSNAASRELAQRARRWPVNSLR